MTGVDPHRPATHPSRQRRIDDHDEDIVELASIADVPAWLGL